MRAKNDLTCGGLPYCSEIELIMALQQMVSVGKTDVRAFVIEVAASSARDVNSHASESHGGAPLPAVLPIM